MTRDDIVALFIENAAKAAAETHRVRSNAELNEVISKTTRGQGPIYCPGMTRKEKAVIIPEGRRSEDSAASTVCIDEALGAIAETGSIVLSSMGGKPVQAGLLAAHHIAIVSSETIFENLDQFFSSWEGMLPTNITLETGPSRTADIELTLTIGVHGPERLSIIVF